MMSITIRALMFSFFGHDDSDCAGVVIVISLKIAVTHSVRMVFRWQVTVHSSVYRLHAVTDSWKHGLYDDHEGCHQHHHGEHKVPPVLPYAEILFGGSPNKGVLLFQGLPGQAVSGARAVCLGSLITMSECRTSWNKRLSPVAWALI